MIKKRFFVGALVYFLFLSFISHIPGNNLEFLPLNHWDKLAHFAMYLPLGMLLALGFAGQGMDAHKWLTPLLVTLMVVVLGAVDECHQSMVPGRYATISDVVADTAGGFVGAIIGLPIGRVVLKKADRSKEQETTRSLP